MDKICNMVMGNAASKAKEERNLIFDSYLLEMQWYLCAKTICSWINDYSA